MVNTEISDEDLELRCKWLNKYVGTLEPVILLFSISHGNVDVQIFLVPYILAY